MAEQSDIVAPAYGEPAGELRPRIPDPAALRSAPHREDRARRRQGGDGQRRRDRPDQGFRRLRPEAERVRLPLRPHHEAHLHRGEGSAAAHRLRRGRGRARAARGAGRRRRRARQADPGRPAGGDRAAHRALRPAHEAGRGFRDRQSRVRRALPRLLEGIPPPHRAPRRLAALRPDRDAPAPHADRRHDDPPRRRRRHDLRHLRHARPAPALHRPGDRASARA